MHNATGSASSSSSARFWRLGSSYARGILIIYLAALIAGLCWLLVHALWPVLPIFCIAMLALFAIDAIEYRCYGEETPRRVAVLFLVLRLLFSQVAILCSPQLTQVLYLVFPFRALNQFGQKGANCMVLVVAGLYVLEIFFDPRVDRNPAALLMECYIFALACIGCVAMTRAVTREMESRRREQASREHAELLLEEVKTSHRQLKIYAQQVKELATLEERNRIAREIHDSLGHSLVAIYLQMEKAQVYYHADPEEALQAVDDARQVAKNALQDVRQSIRALRTQEEPFSCVREARILAEPMRKHGLCVDITVDGKEEDVPQQVLLTFYRVIQEGITNIQKHAHANHAEIHLCFAEEQAHLSIYDDGVGFNVAAHLLPESGRDTGYGLRGIQERVTLLDGIFQLESAPGQGTRLLISTEYGQEHDE